MPYPPQGRPTPPPCPPGVPPSWPLAQGVPAVSAVVTPTFLGRPAQEAPTVSAQVS